MPCALVVAARVDHSFMNTAIHTMASTFKGIRYVNFNHDEIRGSASIRSSVRASICSMSGVFCSQSTPRCFMLRCWLCSLPVLSACQCVSCQQHLDSCMHACYACCIGTHTYLRTVARDSRSLRSGLSNAALLAKDMNTLQGYVTDHLGKGSRAMYFDDMVNPDHNGGIYDYQPTTGGGRAGCTDGALLQKMVTNEVIWFSWAYYTTGRCAWCVQKIKNAPKLFGAHEYDWVGSPYAERSDVVAWSQSLKASKAAGFKGKALGLVDMEWAQHVAAEKWGNIPDVSAATWNLEAFLRSVRSDAE